MHDARRYRYKAAECLLAAQDESAADCRKIRLFMAASWLSLARRDEAGGEIRSRARDTAEPINQDGPKRLFSGNRLLAGTETSRPLSPRKSYPDVMVMQS